MTNKIICHNVYWVEGLKYKFLSVSYLNKSRYKVEFHHRKAKIFGEIIGSGDQTKGNFFYLDLSNVTCLFAQHEDTWLWH